MEIIYVITVKYVQPIERIDALLAAHRAFLDRYYDNGRILCSGPQEPRVGGVILFRAQDRAEVWTFIKEDPFYIQGAAEYDVTAFHARRWGR